MKRSLHLAPAVALLTAFWFLSVLHGSINPLFESSDEFWHIGMAIHLARGGDLPVQQPGVKTPWRQEGSQPPLYYMLLARLTRALGLPLEDYDQIYRPNPHVVLGDASQISNRNQTLHGPWEDPPWRGALFTLHLWRMISAMIAMVGVAATIAWIRLAFPMRPAWALGAGLLMALNPMFLFISASINNDVLVNALAAIALYWMFRIWRVGLRPLEMIALGITLGAAALAKLSGLLLWPLAGLMLTVRLLRDGPPGPRYLRLLIPFTIAILLCGWWFWRNWALYGDPTGLSVMLAIVGRRSASLTDLIREWEGFRRSFWGVFGGMNVVMPGGIYSVLDAFTIASAIGFLGFLWRSMRGNAPRWPWLVALGYKGLVFLGVLRWTSMTMASQGRLMFTALGPIALILWVGWEAWASRLRIPALCMAVRALPPVFLGTLALLAPPLWIAPAYRPLPLPSAEEIASLSVRTDAVFGGKIRLLGLRAGAEVVRPGQTLDLVLYFEALAPTDRPWSLFVHLLDELDIILTQHDGYPFQGLNSTQELHPGQQWKEHVRLRIPRAAVAPTPLALAIGFYDLQTGQRFPIDSDGRGQRSGDHLRVIIGRLEPVPSEVPNPLDARFGGVIELSGYQISPRRARPGEAVRLVLYWRSLRRVAEDYTVFTHILQPPDILWGQHDKPPTPPTSRWEPGKIYVETYTLTLKPETPPGFYEVEVGLYDPETGQRLRREDGEDRVLLSRIRVLP
ncbi:hypothetical protein [Thermoflexus sp.]|uniref:hypothetical protein n=1 Tax=Thermoflexus sp. TaxID=1969742 RepID=UPI002ADD4A88|nr:hypothetical protein [Thermoflexus sp.]